ncbi:penicillin-binding protein 2 [Candidatus Peregrinibacteria bacterium]|nr:penicillin-binding protein 2 [Candidatus Peregrinibacteria bacterium]
MKYLRSLKPKEVFNKINIYIVGSVFVTILIIVRLFQLQVLSHDYYQNLASQEQSGLIELPAQRGNIIIKDYHSNEEFAIATNTSMKLVYVDPTLLKDPNFVANKLESLIFNLQDERATDQARIDKLAQNLPPNLTEDEKKKLLQAPTDAELETQFKENLIKKISEKKRTDITLADNLDDNILSQVKGLNLAGVEIVGKSVHAHPGQIGSISSTAGTLSQLLEIPSKKLETVLQGENRYVVLKRKLDPKISDKITAIMKADKEKTLVGVGMKEEYFRYYPEGGLAANVIGYVDNQNIGQYGIESSFNTQLRGASGKLQTKKDSVGRQITVGESTLLAPVDGDNVVLTVDRSVQLEVEKILARDTKAFEADSGQVLIMNPKNGAIIAMANFPSFDPNRYGDVFKKVEIKLNPDEIKRLYPSKEKGVYDFYVNDVTLDHYPIFEELDEKGTIHYYRYANFRGPEVYHNKIVSWPYEPGSVFKPIIMSSALDDGDVTPNTTYVDSGPVGVDWNVFSKKFDFFIKNSTNKYWGLINMQTVIAKSLNTGMTFVSKKMGPALFYSYLKKFGFLDRTEIEFDNETIGKIPYYDKWTESELATHAFGQGITINMLQLGAAYSALANGGVLMQPYIVDEIRHSDGKVTKTEPRQIRRVISEDSASKITSIMVYTVDNGEGKGGKVLGHAVAGKTGTAQTYKHGIALTGKGSTIGSFSGIAPIKDPQFVVLVKYDHPRSSEWGSNTAAETFSRIATFLFDYYNIPPDRQSEGEIAVPK